MLFTIGAWKQACRIVVTFVAVIAVFLASVGPASAAQARTIEGTGSGVALLQPTQAQTDEAMKRLEQARSNDPAGFAERLAS